MSGRRPKRSLGQNFLVDPAIARRIVEAAGAAPGDPVLEIGPGRGALTGMLAELGGPLVLLEKDDTLAADLERRFAGHPRVVVVHDDAMRVDLAALAELLTGDGSTVRAVANLPYNVASRIALRFLAWDRLRDAVFMFQREVALRFTAGPGSRQYGGLSVMARVWADPYPLFPVHPGAFRPRPRVESHVVRFRLLDRPRLAEGELEPFEAVVRGLFQTRRKTVINSLAAMDGRGADHGRLRGVLAACGIDPSRRAETLSFDDFAALARHL